MGKIFKFLVLTLLENALNRDIFTQAPLPTQNSLPSFCHHTLGRGKSLIPPGTIFFENLFPPAVERSGGNYNLLYQNSIKKYSVDLEH